LIKILITIVIENAHFQISLYKKHTVFPTSKQRFLRVIPDGRKKAQSGQEQIGVVYSNDSAKTDRWFVLCRPPVGL
jgi:hypothetical protein